MGNSKYGEGFYFWLVSYCCVLEHTLFLFSTRITTEELLRSGKACFGLYVSSRVRVGVSPQITVGFVALCAICAICAVLN